MSGGCLGGVGRPCGGYAEFDWMVSRGCVEGVGRLSGGCGLTAWRVCCRMSDGFGEAIWMIWKAV